MTTPTLREAAMAALKALSVVTSTLMRPEKHMEVVRDLRLALTAPEQSPADDPAAPTSGEPVAWIVYWGLGSLRVNSVHLEKATAEKVASEIKSHTEVHPLYAAPAATPAQADSAGQVAYHAWCGSIDDEATLRRAASVMEDVLTDIEGWEDRALTEAVAESRAAIVALADSIALTAAPAKVEGPNREELLGDAIRSLVAGRIKCTHDLPLEERPVHVSARKAFGVVRDLLHKAAPAPHQQAGQAKAVTVEVLATMFESLDGVDKNQTGYHWLKGWNAALRHAIGYATPPSPQQAAQGGERAIEISPEDTEVLQEIGRQITANPGVPVTIPREVADRVKALAPNPAIVGAVDRCASEHWQRRYAAIQSIVQGWADYGRAREKARLAVCHENNKLRKANEQLRAAARAAQGERAVLTDERIDRHTLTAGECPPGSKVMLVSGLKRILGIVTTEGGA